MKPITITIPVIIKIDVTTEDVQPQIVTKSYKKKYECKHCKTQYAFWASYKKHERTCPKINRDDSIQKLVEYAKKHNCSMNQACKNTKLLPYTAKLLKKAKEHGYVLCKGTQKQVDAEQSEKIKKDNEYMQRVNEETLHACHVCFTNTVKKYGDMCADCIGRFEQNEQ